MFASIVIRVLLVIGFTLFPLMLVNVWYQQEVIGEPGRFVTAQDLASRHARYGWLRVSLNLIAGCVTLAIMLALVS